VRLLLDTNVLLEVLLEQQHLAVSKALLERVKEHDFFLTDFALHTIAMALVRKGSYQELLVFLSDTVQDGPLTVLTLGPAEIAAVVETAQRFRLDFDDAYQYVVAEKHDLTLVSFDAHFDRTDRGRRTPAQVLAG